MKKIKFTKDYRARNMILYHEGEVKELSLIHISEPTRPY